MGLFGFLFGKNDEKGKKLNALQKAADQSCADLGRAQSKTEFALKAMSEEEARKLIESGYDLDALEIEPEEEADAA